MAVGENVIFDPTREELSVADVVLAVSVAAGTTAGGGGGDVAGEGKGLTLLSVRVIDTPARLTSAGVPDVVNSAMAGGDGRDAGKGGGGVALREMERVEGVWRPPRGGFKRGMVARMIKMVMEKGGVAEEVLGGLEAVDVG